MTPTDKAKILKHNINFTLERIEKEPQNFIVRWQDPHTGYWVNTSLLDMETGAAIQQVCRFIRQSMEVED